MKNKIIRVFNFIFHFFGELLSRFFIYCVKIYQWFISPILPNSCRYTPTCSAYSIEAFKIWGPIKGFWLTLRRLLRCHPWGGCGYDPVPKKQH